jgi:hypothetical protein
MIWQPNKWQAAALRVYGDGDYRYVVDGTPDSGLGLGDDASPPLTFTDANEFDDWCVENLGDTLLLFIMRELSDANDDGEGGDEMVRMIERAIDDLESVLVPLKLLA